MPENIENESRQTITGTVEEIVFQNPDNGYVICVIESNGDFATVTGTIPGISEGEMIKAVGKWVNHPTYGRQFCVEEYSRDFPEMTPAILAYLSSGAVRGIGPVTAKRIVDMYGDNTLNVIDEHPEWLSDIKGITPKKAAEIAQSFKNQFGMRQVMLYFQGLLSPKLALKVYKRWGSVAIDVFRSNPYLLCDEIDGVSFERADSIAKGMGFDNDDEERIMAGIKYLLYLELNRSGNCYLPLDVLVKRTSEMLGTDGELVKECVVTLSHRTEIIAVKYGNITAVYLENIYRSERYCAEKLKILCDTKVNIPLSDAEKEIEKSEKKNGIKLQGLQIDAVKSAVEEGVMIVTGCPGTGKTTVIQTIIDMFGRLEITVCLAAPTGRAAKRMTESSGFPAKTIHRLLESEYTSDDRIEFQRNEDNPLDYGAVIVDEASMIDIFLFTALLKALKPGTRLILIGDVDQLPPVGAGDVFGDLIKSGSFTTVRLKEIFRQSKDSLIISSAHMINEGGMPPIDNKGNDFFFMPRKSGKELQELVNELCKERLPKAYGYDSLSDIQVVCPSRKGDAGTNALNAAMRELFNPKAFGKNEYVTNNGTFREGDKIMQIRNNYDTEWETPDGRSGNGVFNGDIGFIERIDTENETVEYIFDDGRCATCDISSFEDIEHAYAITVHKSQGSEYKAVIIPLFDCPRGLMTRNMIYTAVTRAQNLVIIVGKAEILAEMIKNNVRMNKYTGLSNMLKSEGAFGQGKG
ncbi:MAG: ATP-dependent RecD-like DNA helicase [Clostridiales bacterium]|nr:ATP-dependent RecD-like DNA helicase [Clostridiales bacterium]